MTLTSRFSQEDEIVHTNVEAVGATLSISDQRMRVTDPQARRPLLDMPLTGLRRIQFDIELERPATLVIVPLHAGQQPQVLAIPPDQYDAAATGLAWVGRFLADQSNGHDR